MSIISDLLKPRQQTVEELKKEAGELKVLAAEYEERAKAIESIRASKDKIAKARERIYKK